MTEDQNRERLLSLRNRQGASLFLRLRPCREGDEEGLIACIRDEYGDTYFKQDFYHPDFLRQKAREGVITFLVAETLEGRIAGMLILKRFFPRETMCEIASQIFRRQYRGYGLAMPFFEYGMDILLTGSYSAAFCLPVLFHDVTQRLLYRLGLRGTGIIMNVFNLETIQHSYDNGRNSKHSQGIQIRALSKRDAGTLYLPKEHREFCEKIYRKLGARFTVRGHNEEASDGGLPRDPAVSRLEYTFSERQQSLEIRIEAAGADLKDRLLRLRARYPLKGRLTANVFLNCSEPQALAAYDVLKEMGYFFTGLKPLCGEREYMVLHNPGETVYYFEDYVVTEEFAEILAYVENSRRNERTAGEAARYEKEKM